MVTNDSTRKSLIDERNCDRRNAIADLYEGCRDKDEKKVQRAILKISIPASSPMDHGFSVHDLYHYLEPIANRLNGIDGNFGLRDILAYKKEQLRRHNIKLSSNNGAGNTEQDRNFRKDLGRDIQEISFKVDFLSRIESVLIEQLKRHGEVVGISQIERHIDNSVAVTTR